MTTHKAPQAKTPYPARESDAGNVQGVIGYLPGTQIYGEGNVFADNDVVQMVKIPSGATVMDCILRTGALGSNVLASVGDGDDVDRYITATSVAANSITRANATADAGVPSTYSDEDTIDVKITNANPDENIAIRLDVFYICGVDTTP